MEERVQKIIAAAGIASRRAAEEMILDGRVKVNGALVTELGTKADPDKDHIKVDGKLINPQQPKTYVMLNKPVGYVTTMSDPEGRPTVADLLKGVRVRVYPVGRLDYDTEGLLLLTNDGDLAHLVTHPRHELPKTYLVKVKGALEDREVESLERGVFLKDGKTAPARVRRLRKEEANSWVEITIHEGRKRQVRRMIDHTGKSVIKLKRTRVGGLELGDLALGTYRHLTADEVKDLREAAQGEVPLLPGGTVSVPSGPGGAKRELTFIEGPKPKKRKPLAAPAHRKTDDRYAAKGTARGGTFRAREDRGRSWEGKETRTETRGERTEGMKSRWPKKRFDGPTIGGGRVDRAGDRGPRQGERRFGKPAFGSEGRQEQNRPQRPGGRFPSRTSTGRPFAGRAGSAEQRGGRSEAKRPWQEKRFERPSFGGRAERPEGRRAWSDKRSGRAPFSRPEGSSFSRGPRTDDGFKPREGQGRSFGGRSAAPAQRGARPEGKRPWSDKRSERAPYSRPEGSSFSRGPRTGDGFKPREGQGRSFGGRSAAPAQRGARPEGKRPWSDKRSERAPYSRPESSSGYRGARTGEGFKPREGQKRQFSTSAGERGARPEGKRPWSSAKPAARTGGSGARPRTGASRTAGPKTGWARPGNDRNKKGPGPRRRS